LRSLPRPQNQLTQASPHRVCRVARHWARAGDRAPRGGFPPAEPVLEERCRGSAATRIMALMWQPVVQLVPALGRRCIHPAALLLRRVLPDTLRRRAFAAGRIVALVLRRTCTTGYQCPSGALRRPAVVRLRTCPPGPAQLVKRLHREAKASSCSATPAARCPGLRPLRTSIRRVVLYAPYYELIIHFGAATAPPARPCSSCSTTPPSCRAADGSALTGRQRRTDHRDADDSRPRSWSRRTGAADLEAWNARTHRYTVQ